MKKTILELAKECIRIEQEALISLTNHLGKSFEECVKSIVKSDYRIILTGIGKSAIVAQKITATMNSTGTKASFLHAADALHGDIGMLTSNDIVCCLSKSGETEELRLLVPMVKSIGCPVIAITSNKDSYLAKESNFVLYTPIDREADPNNLAPTASTAAQMAMGDALAMCIAHEKGFAPEDFAKFHPSGSLGKQLYLRVQNVYTLHGKPCNYKEDTIPQVILTISKNRLGATVVVNKSNEIMGIITDGDLRRMMETNSTFSTITAKEIMNISPKTIEAESLAIDALAMMRQYNISQLVVTQKSEYVGMIHLHDLIKEGFV